MTSSNTLDVGAPTFLPLSFPTRQSIGLLGSAGARSRFSVGYNRARRLPVASMPQPQKLRQAAAPAFSEGGYFYEACSIHGLVSPLGFSEVRA
jgi:hypothetical protein